MKGQVLGKVDHFYWKKEYQARGAPHYHVLLWIRDAPVIDQDDPELGFRRGLLVIFLTRNPGGPNVLLKCPDLHTVKRITADGNCFTALHTS